jgi:hypothetical protein
VGLKALLLAIPLVVAGRADAEGPAAQTTSPVGAESMTFEQLPDAHEGSIEVSSHLGTCAIVHVDACGRRLGLYCAWSDWQQGKQEKKSAKSVELTFTAPKS